MNLDELTAGPGAVAPMAPSDWTMDVLPDGGSFVGIVKRSNRVRCRIMLAGPVRDMSVARSALAAKARAWIAGYLERQHVGTHDGDD